MIYRIRIMKQDDGKLVFDRYATEEEIFGGDILVAPDGNVYEWAYAPESDPMYRFGGYTQEWKLSDTHFVEWGTVIDNKKYYENDIYRHTNRDEVCGVYIAKNGVEKLLEDIKYLHQYTGELICLGNVWENPELLEVDNG